MIEERGEQVRAVTLADQRAADVAAEVGAIGRGEVGQVHPLAVVPELLGRVQLGGVGRQPLDPHAGRRAGGRRAIAASPPCGR